MLKAGDEIRSLARFTGTQRTAFRKLLKKYKKWTGSADLETRFRDEILDDPKSFTKLDLGPLLDDYSETLLNVRTLYETRWQSNGARKGGIKPSVPAAQSAIEKLQAALVDRSRVDFDTAIATVPLGEDGEIANYFVHVENIVELQILMLQHMQYYTSRSRNNSAATPVSPTTPTKNFATQAAQHADYFMLVSDNRERFAQDQSRVTVSKREHVPGLAPQMAKAFVRWNDVEEAMLSVRSGPGKIKSVSLKRKHIDTFFDRDAPAPKKVEVSDSDTLVPVRNEILKDRTVQPLYKLSSCRCRWTGISDNDKALTLATLDSSISMEGLDTADDNTEPIVFPFAVLQVRKEGPLACELLTTLDESHLVERVRGFSLQYHALWETSKAKSIPAPFWIPILSQDIRKLPPPALKRNESVAGSSGLRSAANGSMSSNSGPGLTDSATAVDTTSSSVLPSLLESPPPLRAFRKKRRRTLAEREMQQQQQRYWSEYDHPEGGEEGGDAFVIYIDPNEKSTLDKFFDKIGSYFARPTPEDEEALLHSPTIPHDDETSDEEEDLLQYGPAASYGTMSSPRSRHRSIHASPQYHSVFYLPQITLICFAASIAILTVAYILAQTSKHKYVAEVDLAIIFAVACSVGFSVLGFVPVMRRLDISWTAFGMGLAVVVGDAVASGFLLAWVLG